MKTILKLVPTFKDYLWGGTKLIEKYQKKTSLFPVAESWEISCHPDGESIIDNGIYRGKTLANILIKHPEWMGINPPEEFPVLVKMIDAKQQLSVQVHPNDTYALEFEQQQGKNEMWYVIDAEPDAFLILGTKKNLTQVELEAHIKNNTLLEILNYIPVKAGDCFAIPAGMLHGIGAGILIAEVQQSSNVTYRVYDYCRKGPDGKERPLHTKQALAVTNTSLTAKNIIPSSKEKQILISWPWFTVHKYQLHGSIEFLIDSNSFIGILVLSGDILLDTLTLHAGESAFIPAGLGTIKIHGNGEFLSVQRTL